MVPVGTTMSKGRQAMRMYWYLVGRNGWWSYA